MKIVKYIGLYFILILGFFLLFIGRNPQNEPRSYAEIWNLGHVILFAVFTYTLIRDWKYLSKKTFVTQSWIIPTICLLFGIITELIQVNFDRNPDLGDLGRDVLGGFIVLIFFAPKRSQIPLRSLKILRVIMLFIILFALYPLIRSVVDETISHKQFPVLSDFETPFEKYRWDAYHVKIGIDRTIARSGQASLKVELNTTKYTGLFLKFFPSNWTGYTNLNFSIYNPEQDSLRIICRINDTHHRRRDYRYDDRFNAKYYLQSGWNDISIPLDNIKKAPESRFMDLAKIDLIGIFAVKLPQPRIIYIDRVRLD